MEKILRGKPGDLNIIRLELTAIFDRPDVEIPGTTVEDFLEAFRKALTGENGLGQVCKKPESAHIRHSRENGNPVPPKPGFIS